MHLRAPGKRLADPWMQLDRTMDTMAVGHWLLKLLDAICSVGVCVCVVSCALVHGSRDIAT